MMPSPLHLPLSIVWDFMLDAVFLVDREGIVLKVNNACEAMLGYRPEEMVGRPLTDFQLPDDRSRTAEEANSVLAGGQRVGFENRYVHKNGKTVHLMWSARWLPEHGLRIGVARDVSYRKLADLRNQASYAILATAHEAADLPDLCRLVHRTLERLLPVATFTIAIASPADGVRVLYRHGHFGAGEDPLDWYARLGPAQHTIPATVLRFPKQERFRGALFIRPPAGCAYDGEQRELLRFVTEICALALERKCLDDELLRAAQYDELTGLPNRRLFHDRMTSALARCHRNGTRLGLLFVDVDHFKQVNDRLGHAAGDAVLQEVARRLASCARATDTVARLSGDEFVVIVEDVVQRADIEVVASKIGEAMREPLSIAGQALQVTASVGLALFPDDEQQGERLLAKADAAMYAAKQAARASDRVAET